jgi:flagellar assembly factor FliW
MMKTAELTEPDQPMLGDDDIIHLPLGLLGFERFKEYSLIGRPEEAPFRWLQALDDPSLTFLVVPAFDVLSDYSPNISPEDEAFLGLSSPRDALVFGIVTIRRHAHSTVNLKGPIVLNRMSNRAKQIVLVNAADYPLQYPLPIAE